MEHGWAGGHLLSMCALPFKASEPKRRIYAGLEIPPVRGLPHHEARGVGGTEERRGLGLGQAEIGDSTS